jgi:hypothetical protein
MVKLTSLATLAAVCGALFFTVAPVSAGPLSVALPQENGASSFVQEVAHYGPPPGARCIKWTRRYNPSHGFGHRRCIHWK